MQGVKDRLLYFLNPLGPPNFNSLCLLSPNRLCLELLAAKYRSTATCKNCRLYRRLQGRVFRHHCHEDRPTPYYFDAANVVYIVQYTIMCRESEDNINYTDHVHLWLRHFLVLCSIPSTSHVKQYATVM